jgi:hypothetical protein
MESADYAREHWAVRPDTDGINAGGVHVLGKITLVVRALQRNNPKYFA